MASDSFRECWLGVWLLLGWYFDCRLGFIFFGRHHGRTVMQNKAEIEIATKMLSILYKENLVLKNRPVLPNRPLLAAELPAHRLAMTDVAQSDIVVTFHLLFEAR